jgi:glycosyltransferase involved in cell wall biosynthesis
LPSNITRSRPVADPRALSDEISKLLQSKFVRLQIAAGGRARAAGIVSFTGQSKQYQSSLNDLVLEKHQISKFVSSAGLPRSIRVCFMIDRLSRAGTESQLLALISHLDRRRVQPHLCLLKGEDPESRSLEPRDCPVLRLDVQSFKSRAFVSNAYRFADFLIRERIDVFQPYFEDSTYFGVLAARLLGVPRIVCTSNNLLYWMTPTHARLGQVIRRLSDATIANCQACSDALRAAYPRYRRPVVVLENGIDSLRFASIPALNGRSRRYKVGAVANLRPVKDLDVLVKAAALVRRSHPETDFAIAGEGECRSALEALIRDLGLQGSFALPGATADTSDFLATLDIAVLCSRSEGMSNALLEYMAAGRAIVATGVGGNTALIEDGVNGLLIPPGDPEALAQALDRLLTEPALIAELGRAARADAANCYSLEGRARRFEDFYAMLFESPTLIQRKASQVQMKILNPSATRDRGEPLAEMRPEHAVGEISILPARSETVHPLRERWRSLLACNSSLYVQYGSPDWFDHLLAIESDNLHIAVLRNSQKGVCGLVPLRRTPFTYSMAAWGHSILKWPLNVINVLGCHPLLPEDLRLHDNLFSAIDASFKNWDAIYFRSVVTDTFLWRYLHSSAAITERFYLCVLEGPRPFHYATLPATFDEYLERQFSAKTRNMLKRKVKRLSKHFDGQLRLQRIDSAQQVEQFVEAAAFVQKKSWQPIDVETLSKDRHKFTRKLLDLAQRNILRSYILGSDKTPCAFLLGYQYGGTFHYADPRFNQEFTDLSPGIVLLYLLVEDLITHRPAQQLNFGASDARYKQEFSNVHCEEASVLLFRKTMKNAARRACHTGCRMLESFYKNAKRVWVNGQTMVRSTDDRPASGAD